MSRFPYVIEFIQYFILKLSKNFKIFLIECLHNLIDKDFNLIYEMVSIVDNCSMEKSNISMLSKHS